MIRLNWVNDLFIRYWTDSFINLVGIWEDGRRTNQAIRIAQRYLATRPLTVYGGRRSGQQSDSGVYLRDQCTIPLQHALDSCIRPSKSS